MKKKIKKVIKKKVSKNFNQFVFKITNSTEKEKLLVSNKGLLNYAQNIYDDLDFDDAKKFKKLVNSNGEFDNYINAQTFLNDSMFDINVRIFKPLEDFLKEFVNKGKYIYFEQFNEETVIVK